VEESDDLLSDYTSETTFFDEERSPSTAGESKDVWQFVYYKIEGKVHIFGEWIARTKSHRYVVIGPDWLCVAMTYIVIVVPSVFVYLYLLENLAEKIVFFILFGLTVFGLTTVFVADPGLVRKYHHARSRHWTYWCVHNEEVICCPSGRRGGTHHTSHPFFTLFVFVFALSVWTVTIVNRSGPRGLCIAARAKCASRGTTTIARYVLRPTSFLFSFA